MTVRLAIRHTLPAVMLLIGLLTVTFYFAVTRPKLEQSVEQYAVDHAVVALRTIQGRLNADFLGDASGLIPVEIFYAAANPESRAIFLVDEAGSVRFAHRGVYTGNSISDLPYPINQTLFEKARGNGLIQVGDTDPATKMITGYAGLARTTSSGVERLGLIYVFDYSNELDTLSRFSRSPTEFTIGLLTVISLLLAAGVRLYLDSRQVPVYHALKQLTAGEPVSAADFRGNDEFSEIGLGLVAASQALSDNQRQLTETKQEVAALTAARAALLDQVISDFRPPVTSVTGYFDLLQSMDLPKEAEKAVQNGQLAAKTLSALAGELLELEQLALKHEGLRSQAVNPTLLFQSILDTAVPLAKSWARPFSLTNSSEETKSLMIDELVLKSFTLHAVKTLLPLSDQQGLDMVYSARRWTGGQVLLDVSMLGRFIPDFIRARQPKATDNGDYKDSRQVDLTSEIDSLLSPALTELLVAAGAKVTLFAGTDITLDEILISIKAPEAGDDLDYSHLITTFKAQARLDIMLIEGDDLNRQLCGDILRSAGHTVTPYRDAKSAKKALEDAIIYKGGRLPALILASLDDEDDSQQTLLSEKQSMDERIQRVPLMAMTSDWTKGWQVANNHTVTRVLYKPFSGRDLMVAVTLVTRLMTSGPVDGALGAGNNVSL